MGHYFVAILIAGLCGYAFSSEAQTIRGWGPFKFGQTLTQANSAGGPGTQQSESGVKLEVDIGGQYYWLEALATGPSKQIVTQIRIIASGAQAVTNEETCDRLFDPMAALVAAKFGKPTGAAIPFEDLVVSGRTQSWILKDQSRATIEVTFRRQGPLSEKPCDARIDLYPGKNSKK
jgi:hypothetical protein